MQAAVMRAIGGFGLGLLLAGAAHAQPLEDDTGSLARASAANKAGDFPASVGIYQAMTDRGSAIGPSNVTQYFGSNNHFQVHGGVAVQFYLTDHVFLRPQFDIHYVPNLTQFGSNLVTSETLWLGYTFGSQ